MAPAPPVGFPGCARCPYQDGRSPVTCRRCVRVATGRLRGPGCPVCARPGPTRRCCPNPWCGRPDRGFESVFPVGLHRGGLRRAIAAYKYREQRWWAEVFGALLAAHLRAHPLWFEEYDLLVPMPAYAGPGARRDWDPVGRMFDGLAAAVGDDWEAGAGALVKSRETPALTGRSRPDRLALADRYLAPALSVPDPVRVAGRRILVVDDVLTEGSSLRAAATRLREAGALEVAGLVLARRAPR